MTFETLKTDVINILADNLTTKEKLQHICNHLKANVKHYHWVGFYFKNGDKDELKLGPFAGKPTEHTIIPFGKGICGQVAVSQENYVVQDVSEQDNYISCGFEIKSEIVIPFFVNNKNIGQLDIDSHSTAPFTDADEVFLESVCDEISKLDFSAIL